MSTETKTIMTQIGAIIVDNDRFVRLSIYSWKHK